MDAVQIQRSMASGYEGMAGQEAEDRKDVPRDLGPVQDMVASGMATARPAEGQ